MGHASLRDEKPSLVSGLYPLTYIGITPPGIINDSLNSFDCPQGTHTYKDVDYVESTTQGNTLPGGKIDGINCQVNLKKVLLRTAGLVWAHKLNWNAVS